MNAYYTIMSEYTTSYLQDQYDILVQLGVEIIRVYRMNLFYVSF